VGCLSSRGVDRGGVGNNRGGMDDRVGNGNRGGNRREGSSAVVSDLGDISVDGIRVVVHVLDPAVGKGNTIGALRIACTVACLGGVEVRVGVVVSDGVVEGVGGDLVRVHLGDSVGNGVGNSVGNHRGMVDHRGGMDQGCGMGHSMAKTVSDNAVGKTVSDNTMGKTVSDNRGSMDKRGSVSNAVAHYSVANKTGVASKTMPNHSRGPEDLRGRRGGGCKGCQSNEGLHPG